MKLAQLKTLLAVIETGSFSTAALELGLAQSAVSYSLAELERDLGAKLLERGRFGARATPLGENIASHARSMLQHEACIYQEAKASQGFVGGQLRIAAFRSAAGRLLPQVIKALKLRYPHIQLKLIELDTLDAAGRSKEQLLREHFADLAIVENTKQSNYPELLSWELMRDPYVAVVPIEEQRSEISWSSLEHASLITSDCLSCSDFIAQHLADHDLHFQSDFAVKEDSTILRMVSQGLGMSIMPELAIDELPEKVKCLKMDITIHRVISVALLPRLLKMPAARAFLEILKESFPESQVPSVTPIVNRSLASLA